MERTDFLHAGTHSRKLKAISMIFGWTWPFSSLDPKAKKTPFCFQEKCGWQEKSSPGQPQTFFLNQFAGDFLFSSLLSFFFFCILVFLLVCSLKWKIYILIHIWLCRRVSDKDFFTQPISGNKTAFWPKICCLWL